MTFTEANDLLDEVIAFLMSCGGAYQGTHTRLEEVILDCIVSGQNIIKRDITGAIQTAVFYWFVNKDEIEDVINGDTPADHYHGDTLYIADMGNKGGRAAVHTIVNELRYAMGETVTGIFCNRRGIFKKRMKQRGLSW